MQTFFGFVYVSDNKNICTTLVENRSWITGKAAKKIGSILLEHESQYLSPKEHYAETLCDGGDTPPHTRASSPPYRQQETQINR